MKQKVLDLLEQQEKLNSIINPAGKNDRSRQDFIRAMIVESGELLEHTDYKWWKHGTVDIAQSRMEIVDLWFFYFSLVLLDPATLPSKFNEDKLDFFARMFIDHSGLEGTPDPSLITKSSKPEWDTKNVQRRTLYFVHSCSQITPNLLSTMYELAELTTAAGMTFNDMYNMYMGKLILNIFRQENGYKEGTYRKQWHVSSKRSSDGKSETYTAQSTLEDNQVLTEIMKRVSDPNLIKEALQNGYKATTGYSR